MEYKVIKHLGPNNEQWNNLYEMSKDSKIVRKISNKKELSFKEEKAELTSKNKEKKLFTRRTLYRRSWNKPLPGEEAKPRSKKSKKQISETQKLRAQIKAEKEAIKKERARRREIKAAHRVKKGALLSKVHHDLFVDEVNDRKRKSKCIQIFNKKIFLRNIINKGDVHLIRLESRSEARTGRFFYNIKSKKYLRFNEKVHKPAYGNDAIIWPTLD